MTILQATWRQLFLDLRPVRALILVLLRCTTMASLRRFLLVPALVVLPLVGLSSCGSSAPKHKSASSSVLQCNTSVRIALIPSADRSPVGTWGKAPTVDVPKGKAPAELECAQLISGEGAKAEDGDTVTMQYVLATYSSGGVVQSSWTTQPFSFVLGETSLIPGWVEGVMGMHAGSRRELIIPASLGYGDESPGTGIAANDTLVFIVDLLKVN